MNLCITGIFLHLEVKTACSFSYVNELYSFIQQFFFMYSDLDLRPESWHTERIMKKNLLLYSSSALINYSKLFDYADLHTSAFIPSDFLPH